MKKKNKKNGSSKKGKKNNRRNKSIDQKVNQNNREIAAVSAAASAGNASNAAANSALSTSTSAAETSLSTSINPGLTSQISSLSTATSDAFVTTNTAVSNLSTATNSLSTATSSALSTTNSNLVAGDTSLSTATGSLSTNTADSISSLSTATGSLSTNTADSISSLSTATGSLSTNTADSISSLSTATGSLSTNTADSISSLSTATGSLSTNTADSISSLSTTSSSAEASLSTTVVDNATKADLNTVYAIAGNNQVLVGLIGGALVSSGVSLTGGAYVDGTTENVTAHALLNGSPTTTVKYGPSNVLWGYSPDVNFTTTAVDVTLNGVAVYNGPAGATVGWSLLGGTGNDSIIGSVDIDTALGGNGNDTINGGGGADSIDGGLNDDLFLFSDQTAFNAVGNGGPSASLIGGGGTDTISITTAGQTITDPDFTNVDTVEALLVANGAGSSVTIDTEAQAGGIVSLFGGTGGDTFTAGAAYSATSVTLVGDDGADSLTANTANDLILGGNDNDTINGGGGADSIDGGFGDDLFLFSNQVDFAAVGNGGPTASLIGGNGTDTISITTAGQTIADADFTDVDTVEALLVADGAGSSVTINTAAQAGGIVSLFGGTGGDTFTAGAAYNATSVTLVGNDGADSLTSNTANDLILGGNDNDTINGGGGADSIDGGAGDDLFLFSTRATFAQVGNGGITASLIGGADADTISITTDGQSGGDAIVDADFTNVDGVEALQVADGVGSSVTIDTEAQAGGILSLFGGNGGDTFTAGAAYDGTAVTLIGNDGDDELTAANAADFLSGGDGDDILQGFRTSNTGIDTLTGGAGADTFVLGVTGGANGYGAQLIGDIALITDYGNGADIVQISDLGLVGAWSIDQVFANAYVIANAGVNQYGLERASGTEGAGDAVWQLTRVIAGPPTPDQQLASFENIDTAKLGALTTVGNWSFIL